ncbi:MAG: response regulator [candidate division WOR-3 bacterium]|nr:MAG: response regulator [candidate division WOR-3 bacterium]
MKLNSMNIGNPKILIIDDEEAICDACCQVLSGEGCLTEVSFEGVSGLKKLDDFKPDVVFVDLKMPGIGGMEVLAKIAEKDTNIVTIVITGYATIESAVESMKNGAFDFLPKPFTPDELRLITRRALEKRKASLEAERLKEEKEMMRQNFISLVSHELRTPLVAVMQYLEVLGGGIAGTISQEQSRIINRIKIRLNELLALIDRWLKLSRIEELKLNEGFQDFSLAEVIDEAVELVQPLADEKNVSLQLKSIAPEILVYGEREMVKEIFTNLLNNGIKYNRENGSVVVESREEGDFWVIDISDTGVGISDDQIPRVTEEFYRIKREGSAAGSGLGLAIVKKILDIHNGKLEIKSTLNQGSTFSVYLPRSSMMTGGHS